MRQINHGLIFEMYNGKHARVRPSVCMSVCVCATKPLPLVRAGKADATSAARLSKDAVQFNGKTRDGQHFSDNIFLVPVCK